MKSLRLKQIGWVLGILWIALVAAFNRAEFYGLQWEWVPDVLQNSLLFGSPVLLLVAALSGKGLENRLSAAAHTYVIAVLLGCLYVAADDAAFRCDVHEDLSVDQDRLRWWPLGLFALTSMDGDCYAFME